MFLGALVWFSIALCHAGNRPPNIYLEPADRDIYFKQGETVKIECAADGQPKPRYTWKRNEEIFNPSGQDDRVVQLHDRGTLVFNNPESKDEGIFQCFAENGYGVSVSVKFNLREAILKKFVYEPKRTHRVHKGDELTLPCTPPQSIPVSDVYWVTRSPDGRWEAVNFNKRVTMDFEGRLRVTNTLNEDEASGRTYCCMVSNYFMRDNSIGPEHQVVVTGDTEYKRPAHELWTSPNDQFFLRGETLRLKCIFAGSPTPEIYWERLDSEFPARASFKSFAQELRITELEFSDAGQYQCMGLNSQSTQRATKAFNVRIESRPYWVNEPVDVERGVGEVATFICRAAGVPETYYDWFINGVPLDDRNNKVGVRDPRIYNNLRLFKPNKNNITLTNLTLDDHMNIQCNASNKHGSVFADVYLSVLAEKPKIIKLPPPHKKVTEGQSVILECLVIGKPDPIVTWYRDDSRMTGGRFQIKTNGNLHISKVVMADAGQYRCEAYNIFGNVTSPVCKTHIRRKTRIKEHPGDLEVTAGNEAKFTCSGSTDFNEARNMRIYWEKDDKRLYYNQQRVTQNFQDNSLTISGAIVRDSGVYTCVVTNGLDEDSASAILTVKGRPDPPSEVEIERCHDDSAYIKWIKGIENNAPVQYFIIQYNTSFYPDQWTSAISVGYTHSTATIPLKPWGNYTFRVFATNKIGTSLPSVHTHSVCTTKAGRPDKNPDNLQSVGDTRNTLKLHWTPMNELDHNGPGFKYILSIREFGGTRFDTYSINNWRNSFLEIPNNKPAYSPYLVRLHAKNDIGDSKEAAVEKILYSFEDIPKVRPYNVEVTYSSDTFANISWSWDAAWQQEEGQINVICGKLKGFKVQYWRTDDKLGSFCEVDVLLEHFIRAGISIKGQTIKSEFTLSKLFPYSSMQAQIRIVNNHYAGPPSDVASFSTLEGVPGPVTRVTTLTQSRNSIIVSWRKPNEEDCNGIIIGYEIGYQTVDGLKLGLIQDQIGKINDADTESAIIGGLLPASKYRIHIYPRTRRGRGQGVFIEETTTSEFIHIAPTIDIHEVMSTSIYVTWGKGADISGEIVHYVNFRKRGASAWQRTNDEVLRKDTVLAALEAGTEYEVRVVAFDGYSRFYSNIIAVRTTGIDSTRALAANYVWFASGLTAGFVVILATVFIFLLRRRWKDVKDNPRYKRGVGINAVAIRHFFHHRDSFAKKPLVKDTGKNKMDKKQRRRGQGRRLYRGRFYKSVGGHGQDKANGQHGDALSGKNESDEDREHNKCDSDSLLSKTCGYDKHNGDNSSRENVEDNYSEIYNKNDSDKCSISHDNYESSKRRSYTGSIPYASDSDLREDDKGFLKIRLSDESSDPKGRLRDLNIYENPGNSKSGDQVNNIEDDEKLISDRVDIYADEDVEY